MMARKQKKRLLIDFLIALAVITAFYAAAKLIYGHRLVIANFW